MQNLQLQKGNTYLSVLADEYYAQCLLEVVERLRGKTICFVTLNKTAGSLERAFAFHGRATKSILFIDAVSQGIGQKQEKENVLYVSSPEALTELSIAISEVIRTKKFDSILFDSLSTLSIYDIKEKAAERFVASVIEKTKAAGRLGVFTCLETDFQSALIQKSCMYVDNVVSIADYWREKEQRKKSTKTKVLAMTLLGFVGLFFFRNGFLDTPTGFFMAGTLTPASFLLFGITISWLFTAVVLAYLLYRKCAQIRSVSHERLLKIKSGNRKPAQLRKLFRAKISHWLQGKKQ